MRAALLVLVAIAPPAVAGPCAMTGLAPDVVTPPGTAIAAGGGVVVGVVPGGSPGSGDPSSQPTWRFVIGGKRVAPARTPLAPGLTLYALPAGATAARLEDGSHARMAEVTVAAEASKPLGAPAVSAAVQTTTHWSGPRPGSSAQIALALTAAAPPEAIALVVYGSDGAPREWTRATPDLTYVLSGSPSRCETPIPGRVTSVATDKLTFAWIDRSGRPSARSAAITVGRVNP